MPVSPGSKVVKHAKMQSQAEREVKITAALNDLEKGICKSVRAAAKCYGISPATLARRKKGGLTQVEAHRHQQHFTPEQEDLLVTTLKRMAEYGFPVTHKRFRSYANALLASNTGDPNAQVSQWWSNGFIARHPDLKGKFSRSSDSSRSQAARPGIRSSCENENERQ